MSSTRSRTDIEMRIQQDFVRAIAGVILFNHQVSEQLGLGPSDSQFLTLLQQHGQLTPGQLAKATGLSTGTVTGVIDRLERVGLARRDRDPGDRRKVIVSLDQKQVERKLFPVYAGQAQRLGELLSGFDDKQLEVVATFVAGLARGAEEDTAV
jgi:DNA-binding MarR family transcriptional regulator